MATLLHKKGKTPGYEIQFFETDGRRRSIYLGGLRYSEKTANGLKDVVEALVYCRDNTTTPDKRTLTWIESASPEIREKLAKVGLVEIPPSHTLKEVWDTFLVHKEKELKSGNIKEATYELYDFLRKRFFLFFDKNESLDELDKDRMQKWKDHLLDEVAEATVGFQ